MAKIPFPPRHHCFRLSFNTLLVVAYLWMSAGVCLAGGFCAIAYSEATGRHGYSKGFNNKFDAQERALQECGARDGRVVVWVHNGYIALARGSGAAWGSGSGSTRREAENIALRNCPGGNATIVQWAYSFD